MVFNISPSQKFQGHLPLYKVRDIILYLSTIDIRPHFVSYMDSSSSMLLSDNTEFSGTDDQGLFSGRGLLLIDNILDPCNILLIK